MKRLLWLGVGLAIGALVVRAVTKKAQSYTPRGIAAGVRDSGRNALDSVRDFVDDVREGMHERERELHAALAEAGAPSPHHEVEDLDPPALAEQWPGEDFEELTEDELRGRHRTTAEGTTG